MSDQLVVYRRVVENSQQYQARFQRLLRMRRQDRRYLKSSTESLATAELQSIVKWVADVASGYRLPERSDSKVELEQTVENIPAFMPIPIQSLSEITQRPLFTEGRTSPENPEDNPQAVAASAPLRLKLEGVAITPERKVAIITDLQSNELLR